MHNLGELLGNLLKDHVVVDCEAYATLEDVCRRIMVVSKDVCAYDVGDIRKCLWRHPFWEECGVRTYERIYTPCFCMDKNNCGHVRFEHFVLLGCRLVEMT